jgi:hypothetical protein
MEELAGFFPDRDHARGRYKEIKIARIRKRRMPQYYGLMAMYPKCEGREPADPWMAAV